MKPIKGVGLLLVIIGIVGFALGGFSFTREKKVVDMGPVQIKHQETKNVLIPPILSTVALIGEFALVIMGAGPRARQNL